MNGSLVDGSENVSITGYKSYPSAHIVVGEKGIYSKHYYLGKQIIISRLGDESASIFEVEDGGVVGKSLKTTSGGEETALDPKELQNAQKLDLVNLLKETRCTNFVYEKYQGSTMEEQNKL
jgi:hypothetical protein